MAWDAIAKRAPADIAQAVKEVAGAHPEAAKLGDAWTQQTKVLNEKLRHLLDDVINAQDEKIRVEMGKKALADVKQYQNFVNSTHLPPGVQGKLKNGLAELARGLG